MVKTVIAFCIGLIAMTGSSFILARYKQDNKQQIENYQIAFFVVAMIYLLLTTGCIICVLFVLDIFANRDVKVDEQA